MRILFITDLYPISKDDEPKTLLSFVNRWKQSGHSIDVIRPNFLFNAVLRSKKIYIKEEYTENGINILNLNFFTPFLFNIKNKLPKDFDLHYYDVVISHMPSGTLFASKLIEGSKIPFVCSVHASDIEVLTSPTYKFYFSKELKKAYERADLISARSYVLAEKIKSLIPNAQYKTFTAFSGIEERHIESEEFFTKKLNHLARTEKIKILTTASLIKRKNIDIVLDALSKLEFKSWQYAVIGGGPELKRLMKLAKKLGIDKKVVFLNKLSRKKVFEFLEESDIFILPSENETFGMAYLEAMSKANIVICTKNDGIDGIIKHNINGFAIPSNSKKLASTISKIKNMQYEQLREIYLNSYKTIYQHTEKMAANNYIENVKKIIAD